MAQSTTTTNQEQLPNNNETQRNPQNPKKPWAWIYDETHEIQRNPSLSALGKWWDGGLGRGVGRRLRTSTKWVNGRLVTLRPTAMRQRGESSEGVESESRLDKKSRKKKSTNK